MYISLLQLKMIAKIFWNFSIKIHYYELFLDYNDIELLLPSVCECFFYVNLKIKIKNN